MTGLHFLYCGPVKLCSTCRYFFQDPPLHTCSRIALSLSLPPARHTSSAHRTFLNPLLPVTEIVCTLQLTAGHVGSGIRVGFPQPPPSPSLMFCLTHTSAYTRVAKDDRGYDERVCFPIHYWHFRLNNRLWIASKWVYRGPTEIDREKEREREWRVHRRERVHCGNGWERWREGGGKTIKFTCGAQGRQEYCLYIYNDMYKQCVQWAYRLQWQPPMRFFVDIYVYIHNTRGRETRDHSKISSNNGLCAWKPTVDRWLWRWLVVVLLLKNDPSILSPPRFILTATGSCGGNLLIYKPTGVNDKL